MLRLRVALAAMTNGPGLSTFYFTGTTQAIADDAAAAVSTFYNAIEPLFVGYGTWALQPQVAVLNAGTGALEAVLSVTPQSGNGSAAGEQLALATQGLLQLNTGVIVHNRQLRGRMYIPGPTEGFNVDGRPSQAYRDALVGAAAGLVADVGNEWVVWSRPFAGTPGNPARVGTSFSIATVSADTDWGVMRSRRD